MSKRRKKKKEAYKVDESWLLPYADLLTLLLALFIVLFASSTLDVNKFNQISSVFNEIFDGGQGVMDHAAPITTPIPTIKEPEDEENLSYLEDQKSLSEIQDRVDEYIAENKLENLFETKLTDEGLLVTIRDSILFSPGHATIKSEYLGIADDIAELLVFDEPRQIVVTGHTDTVPIQNTEFQSNWELSVMRAVNFMRSIMRSDEIDPLLFSAKGYGEFHPIAPNDTSEGRSKNRRVEVLIQPLVLQDGTKLE
ncbi:flagellar motor protein MotB [Sporosarcina limicola]|uniref:Chemotaxis protein MotB n=1 Tax=Sporosarcina limicola TaxID=34101 RepID=A0A927ML23_9BACL|nr:flagellar motor protein MotB [Sporosarcina limicola]MBE1555876.1 chemotaxis protein MotB [Sporosarcina limicola]